MRANRGLLSRTRKSSLSPLSRLGWLRLADAAVLMRQSHDVRAAYSDPRMSPASLRAQVLNFARQLEVEGPRKGEPLEEGVRRLSKAFFPEDPRAERLMRTFTDLVHEAQRAGDLAPDLGVPDLLTLVFENLGLLALQTAASNQQTLSDHGLEHVWHNIQVALALLDQLPNPPSALDRLVVIQALILHDAGRVSEPVQENPNQGIAVRDAHRLYISRILQERLAHPNPGDPLPKVFGRSAFSLVHAVRTHDLPPRRFTSRASTRNLASAVRFADGSHAFDSKLPPLARRSDFWPYLFVIQAGSPRTAERAKAALERRIPRDSGLNPALRQQLAIATRTLTPSAAGELVTRLFGEDPSLCVLPDGKVTVTLRPSRAHVPLQRLFGQNPGERAQTMLEELKGGGMSAIRSEPRALASPLQREILQMLKDTGTFALAHRLDGATLSARETLLSAFLTGLEVKIDKANARSLKAAQSSPRSTGA